MSDTNIPSEIKEMDKAMNALFLVLPEGVAHDVKQKWEAAKALASKTIAEKDQRIKEIIAMNERLFQKQASTIASLEAENKELKEQYGVMDGRRERAIKSLEESEKQFEQLQEAYNKLSNNL